MIYPQYNCPDCNKLMVYSEEYSAVGGFDTYECTCGHTMDVTDHLLYELSCRLGCGKRHVIKKYCKQCYDRKDRRLKRIRREWLDLLTWIDYFKRIIKNN